MKAKFNFMSIIGGLAGGMAASYVETFFEKEDGTKDEKSYTPSIVQAVAGAAISAFTAPGGAIHGIGDGMVGAAGYSIAKVISANSDDTTPKNSGVGQLLQSQNAVGAIGRRFRRRPISGTEETGGQNAVQNVQ